MNNRQRCANDKMINGQVILRHFIRKVCQRKETCNSFISDIVKRLHELNISYINV